MKPQQPPAAPQALTEMVLTPAEVFPTKQILEDEGWYCGNKMPLQTFRRGVFDLGPLLFSGTQQNGSSLWIGRTVRVKGLFL